MSALAALAALAVLLPATAPAASTVGPTQPGVFRQTDLDGGGWLTGFASHSGGRLYARTDVGGAYRSDDHGATWQFISGNLTSPAAHFVQGLAAGTTSADLLFQSVGTSYAASDPGRGIWRTTDGGGQWTQVLTNVNFSGNDDMRWQGECLAITPGSADQEIFAITRKGGLWRSTSGGGAGSWSKQNGTVFDGLIGHVVHMDAAFPNDVFVGGIKDTASSALYKGTRGAGGSIAWAAVTVSPSTTSVTRLARLPGGVMFAAVQEGSAERFYQSNATGTVWTNITTAVLGGQTSNGPVGMCHVLRDGSTIILGWLGGPTRKSTNGGATWTSLPLTITGPRPPAMLPGESSPGWSRGAVHQDPLDPNRWYLPNGAGPFLTTDAGATVQPMTAGIGEVVARKPAFHPNDPNRIYLPVADLIGFVVTDGGATGLAQRNARPGLPVTFGNVGMTFTSKALTGPVSGNASPKTYFIGGADYGPNAGRATIVTTPDDGLTWSLVHVSGVTGTGLPANGQIVSGCIAPDNANEILVAVHDATDAASGIYRSINGGVAFTKATGIPAGGNWGDAFSHFVRMESDATNPARRFAWLNGVGFLLSADRGLTWSSAGHSASGPAAGKLYDWNSWGTFARDAITGRLWFGGLDGHLGLAFSGDQGNTWSYLDPPFSNTGFSEITALDAHNSQVVVFGKRFGDSDPGLFYSSDNGATWHLCTKPGFRLPTTSEIALDPHHPGSFWVAASGRSYARFTPGGFGAWQQENFTSQQLNNPAISAGASDPDGDASSNLLEYALATNPAASSSHSPANPVMESTSGVRTLRFHRNPAATDLTYTLQASPNLTTWNPAASFAGNAVLPTAFGPGIDLMENPLTHDIAFRRPTSATREFYRLTISLDTSSAPPPIIDSFPANPLNPVVKGNAFSLNSGTTDYVYVPTAYDGTHNTPTTLLVWLHGCGGYSSGDVWTASPGGAQSWITLAPGGAEGGCWNMNTDPLAVLNSIEHLKTRLNIHPRHIVLGGYSSGGDLAYRLAFYHADLVAGILVANTSPYRDTGSTQAASLAAASWKFNIVHLAHLQDTTYPIAGVRSETDTLTAAGFPLTRIERPGTHYDNPGALVNAQPVPGTSEDIRTLLLPWLNAGWTTP